MVEVRLPVVKAVMVAARLRPLSVWSQVTAGGGWPGIISSGCYSFFRERGGGFLKDFREE